LPSSPIFNWRATAPVALPTYPPSARSPGFATRVYLLTQSICNSLFTSIFLFFVFFVLRVLLRKQWLAAAAFILLTTVVISGPGSNWIDRPFQAAYAALFAFILLRFGLLALMVAIAAQGRPWKRAMERGTVGPQPG